MVVVVGHVARGRRGVLWGVHVRDGEEGAVVWWWRLGERDRAQAGACSPWNAQTEGGPPCAIAEAGGCEGSSSSARGGEGNPGLTAAHLVGFTDRD